MENEIIQEMVKVFLKHNLTFDEALAVTKQVQRGLMLARINQQVMSVKIKIPP